MKPTNLWHERSDQQEADELWSSVFGLMLFLLTSVLFTCSCLFLLWRWKHVCKHELLSASSLMWHLRNMNSTVSTPDHVTAMFWRRLASQHKISRYDITTHWPIISPENSITVPGTILRAPEALKFFSIWSLLWWASIINT